MHKYAFSKKRMHIYAFILHKSKYAIICKLNHSEICTKYSAICSTKYARNMPKLLYKNENMKYVMYVHNNLKCAKYRFFEICINMHSICRYMIYMLEYA